MSVEGTSSIKAGTSASTKLEMERYINLSDYTYTSGLSPFSPELEKELHLKPLTNSNGTIVKCLVNRTGFYGEAFVTTGKGPQQVIVAYEGTNIPTAPTDRFAEAQIQDDYQLFKGGMPSSFQTALKFTQRAMSIAENEGVSSSSITVCGHSLGAADAEYVSSKLGLGGATFGTPGVSTKITGSDAGSKLMNYVDQGDPVGNYSADAPRYLGEIVQANDIRHFGNTKLVGADYHSFLLEAAAEAYAKHSPLGDTIAAAALGFAASQYHVLGNYAKDLGLTLYGPDRTTGSDAAFFNQLLGVHDNFGHRLIDGLLGSAEGALDHGASSHAAHELSHPLSAALEGARHGARF